MRSIAGLATLCIAVTLAVLATSAAAAPKPISGKLAKPNYTVIGLAANGKAKAVLASRGSFKLRPPAARVTLHLRAPNGSYAGPIVVGRKQRGRRAIVGVKAGARLGRIGVRRGYAKLSKRLRKRWADADRTARARRGVPLGARAFGRVRSRPPRRSLPGDQDLDGVPDLLDIDDDGDLILDSLDRSGLARAAQEEGRDFQAFSRLSPELPRTANANHPALAAQIDTTLASSGDLLIGPPAGPPLPADAELDCAARPNPAPPPLFIPALVYCSPGGTGRLPYNRPMGALRFPDDVDSDGDGFGTLTPDPPGPAPPPPGTPTPMSLRHGANASQIGTGDLLILRASDRDRLLNLGFVFATTPALVSYDDGQGNAVTVPYPVAPPSPGPPATPGGPGMQGNGLPVKAGPNGEVVLTLRFWRPQRRPIPPEKGWMDIGHLIYGAKLAGIFPFCPQSAYSEQDPELRLSSGNERGGVVDLADDRRASPGLTLTYTLNVTQCLGSNGFSFSPDEVRGFDFFGNDSPAQDITSQPVYFKRQ